MTGFSRRTLVTTTGLAAAGLALPGCSGEESAGASGNGQVDKVTYLTGFGILGRECYVHVAAAKGYFRDANIEVTIQPGQAGTYNHNQMLAGKAQFGAVDSSGALIRSGKAEKAEDKSLRIVAAVQQLTLNVIAAWQDGGIHSPQDLAGKTLGTAIGAVPRTLFPAYARIANIDPATVKWIETAPPQVPSLLVTNKVQALATFNVAVPGVEKAARGRKAVIFPYSDVLTDLLGNVILAPQRLIETDPDLVTRFVQALMRGLKYAVTNPQEAGQILHQADPTQNVELAATELNLLKPYTLPVGGKPVGTFDESRMAKNIAVLQGLGLIPSGLTPDQVADTRFLPKSDS
jgi:NitT/TauT family transport system substrate-binding protein